MFFRVLEKQDCCSVLMLCFLGWRIQANRFMDLGYSDVLVCFLRGSGLLVQAPLCFLRDRHFGVHVPVFGLCGLVPVRVLCFSLVESYLHLSDNSRQFARIVPW